MLFPVIRIKENSSHGGAGYIVGTNRHDCLFIEDNAIHYLDMQCMESTRHPEKSQMCFVGMPPDEGVPYMTVEMVTIEELIRIAEQNMVQQTEFRTEMHEAFREYMKTKCRCDKKRSRDDILDTSGVLF